MRKSMCLLVLLCLSLFCISPKKGPVGIGYGTGFKNGTKNIDSLINSLTDSTKSDTTNKINYMKGGSLKGKRSKKEIMKAIMPNLAGMRYCYNKRLRDKPDLKGKISIKFEVVSSGKVNKSEIIETTLNDSLFENQIREKVQNIQFPIFSVENDTTEVIYPFIFLH